MEMQMSEYWYGYLYETIQFEGKNTIIVHPKDGNAIGRLAIKTEYWGAFPEAAELELLNKGFHLCYIENGNRWGTDDDLDRKARFIQHITSTLHLDPKVVCVGMSCGGLIAIKLAAKYPELISCLYLDAPVLNYMSCPCGFGEGLPLGDDCVEEILSALGMTSISQLIGYREMPLDKLPALIASRIPVVMVAGDSDQVVPYHENGLCLQKVYQQTDIPFAYFIKPGCDHHPHGLTDNREVISFILSH